MNEQELLVILGIALFVLVVLIYSFLNNNPKFEEFTGTLKFKHEKETNEENNGSEGNASGKEAEEKDS